LEKNLRTIFNFILKLEY